MGNWNITIRGVGCHHNVGYEKDANRMAAEFVQKLRDAGHSVASASITFGGEDDLSCPKRYLDDRDAIDESNVKSGYLAIDGSGVARKPRCGKDLGPQIDGECEAKPGVLKLCPDADCPVHGTKAPHRACRLVEGHEGNCEPPVVWQRL